MRDLNLSQCGTRITSRGIAALTLMNIERLTMEGMRLGVAEAFQLAKITSLTHLFVARNQIGDSGAAYISRHRRLVALDIGFNGLGDAGVRAVCRLPTLTALHLSGTDIPLEAAFDIAGHATLKTVSICDSVARNPQLINIVALSTHITDIRFDDTPIDDATMHVLATTSTLTSLDLRRCAVSGAGVRALARNRYLKALDLSGNPLDVKDILYLVERCEPLTRLTISNVGLRERETLSVKMKWEEIGLDLSKLVM